MSAAMTANASAEPTETDAVVIGAGPVGLFQVFELGLLGMHADVIDSLPFAGGQCVELYADKPIYDIPATQVCTGRELVARLLAQIEPFAPSLHLGQQVDVVRREADGRFRVETSAGVRLLARVVMIASGVGSFQPRRLKVEGLAAFEGTQLFYGAPEPAALAGRRVLIIGDADAALDCALDLAVPGPTRAANVTLMHRRDEFKAAPATISRMRELCAAGRMAFIAAQPIGLRESEGRLSALQLATADDRTPWLELDAIVAFTGVSPKLGPVAQWGLNLERKQIVVDTARFETNTRGIFAVGDIVTYPGKRKLIVSGFHEATLAAFAAAAQVYGKSIPLEYTTTSPRLQRLLGAKSDTR